MSTISAGLVNVTNLTVTGTQSGAVTASNLTVTNLSAVNVEATNLSFNNLDVSGNLTVSGDVNIDGTTSLNGLDNNGNLNNFIMKYSLSSNIITEGVSTAYLIAIFNGNLYAANYGSNSITVYNSSGVLINTFSDSVVHPSGIAVNENGNIYVSNYGPEDTGPFNITVYDPSGVLINTFDSGMNYPNAITFGPGGNLYVPNQAGGNVTVYDPSGVLVNTLSHPTMTGPYAITFGTEGKYYVLNNPNPFGENPYTNISLYDSSNNLLQTITEGVGNADALISATINGTFNLYCSNLSNNKISVYSVDGVLVNTIEGGMNQPGGIAFNTSNELYVSNVGNNIITSYVLSTQTSTLTVDNIGNTNILGNLTIGGTYVLSSNIITEGVNIAYLIAIFDGNLYAANYGSDSVTVYNSSGVLINTFSDSVVHPSGIAINENGNIYVSNYGPADMGPFNITVYDPSGILINTFDSSMNYPNAITFGPDGNLYVPNQAGGNVTVYDPSGVLVNTLSHPTMTGPYAITFGTEGKYYVLNNPNPFGENPYTNISLYDSSNNLLQTIIEEVGNADALISATINGTFNLYCSNLSNNKISVYSVDGVLVNTIEGGMNQPGGIAFNTSNELYVSNVGIPNSITSYNLPVSTTITVGGVIMTQSQWTYLTTVLLSGH